MTEQQLLDDMDVIWKSLPGTVEELTIHIDRYIFEAQRGYAKCTELLILYSDKECEAKTSYKKALAGKMIDARRESVAATARKEYALTFIVQEDIDLMKAEFAVHRAGLMRDKWMETINTYKKIKGESFSSRSGGY
jgi:hypothetical protein